MWKKLVWVRKSGRSSEVSDRGRALAALEVLF